jgi:hypothetical protein
MMRTGSCMSRSRKVYVSPKANIDDGAFACTCRFVEPLSLASPSLTRWVFLVCVDGQEKEALLEKVRKYKEANPKTNSTAKASTAVYCYFYIIL